MEFIIAQLTLSFPPCYLRDNCTKLWVCKWLTAEDEEHGAVGRKVYTHPNNDNELAGVKAHNITYKNTWLDPMAIFLLISHKV